MLKKNCRFIEQKIFPKSQTKQYYVNYQFQSGTQINNFSLDKN